MVICSSAYHAITIRSAPWCSVWLVIPQFFLSNRSQQDKINMLLTKMERGHAVRGPSHLLMHFYYNLENESITFVSKKNKLVWANNKQIKLHITKKEKKMKLAQIIMSTKQPCMLSRLWYRFFFFINLLGIIMGKGLCKMVYFFNLIPVNSTRIWMDLLSNH